MLALALAATGCSSTQLDSLISKEDAGATRRPNANPPAYPVDAQVSDADLAYAGATAAQALTRGPAHNNVPWHNPQTGGGGNITLLTAADGRAAAPPCRDFLASYWRGTAHGWLQGSACRSARGAWQVKTVKPLKSS